MADVSTWSTTAGSNNSTPPDGWPEGQNPSTVNDCAREMMAQVATWRQKLGGWFMDNVGIAAAVAANDLTVSLKVKDGSTNPSSTNKVGISFRSATLTSGAFEFVQATAATSVVLPATGTLGAANSQTIDIYVYAINNAGTIELAISGSSLFDEGIVYSTTAIGTGSDTSTVLYSTSARSNVAVRLIGKVTVQHGTAAWTNAPTAVVPYSPEMNTVINVSGYVSGGRTYLNESGSNSTSFNVVTAITESTFESVGPTGASATNTWTAMDDIPAGARIAIVGFLYVYDPTSADTISGLKVYARATGNSTAVGTATLVHAFEVSPDDDVTGSNELYFIAPVPLDSSRRVDLTWEGVNADGEGMTAHLKGFVL